jgi:hypothetical protein
MAQVIKEVSILALKSAGDRYLVDTNPLTPGAREN